VYSVVCGWLGSTVWGKAAEEGEHLVFLADNGKEEGGGAPLGWRDETAGSGHERGTESGPVVAQQRGEGEVVRKERGEEGEAASGPQRGRESSLFGGRTAEIEDVDTPRTCGQAKCVKETHRSGVRKRSKGRARGGAGEGTGSEEI
jgi:hypothetical protein